jgi:hypothetical protein
MGNKSLEGVVPQMLLELKRLNDSLKILNDNLKILNDNLEKNITHSEEGDD